MALKIEVGSFEGGWVEASVDCMGKKTEKDRTSWEEEESTK